MRRFDMRGGFELAGDWREGGCHYHIYSSVWGLISVKLPLPACPH